MIWVRVWYMPQGTPPSSMWTYGWSFCSQSMSMATDTIRHVGDWHKWQYKVAEILADDIDHPDNSQATEKLFRKYAFRTPSQTQCHHPPF